MSDWLLGVAGIVIIGALVEVLLTESSIHKFVRSIYAFFVLFVIAQPLPALFRDASNAIQTGGAIELDSELIERINSQTAAALVRNTQAALETAGFDGVIVTVFNDAVYVNALGASFRNQAANIDMKKGIIQIVSTITGASGEVINYVG